MDSPGTKAYFHHVWWRIALILGALIAFILTCVFNGLASGGPNGVFKQRTGSVSDENLTDFTPAGWTFSIWGLIYFWQAAWLLYAISRIPRRSNSGFLYLAPDTLSASVFILYIINLILNIVWLILWDREDFGWAVLVIFLMFLTVIIPMVITHVRLQNDRPTYVNSNLKKDIWLVRVFVHNGLAIYGTWLYLATMLNLTIWVSQIYDRKLQSMRDMTTAAITLVLIAILVYFICENFIFYRSMAYTFTPWFVLVFALIGILSNSKLKGFVSDRNKSYTIVLLVITCMLIVFRLVLFGIRYVKRQIPTVGEP